MPSGSIPIDQALQELQGRVQMLHRIGSHSAALPHAGALVQDTVLLANSIGEFLQYPGTTTKGLLLVMAQKENIEWITEGFGYMKSEVRARTYAAVIEALTNTIEALYKKWHDYNNLGLDDANHLRQLECLLEKVAERYHLALPERTKVLRKAFNNYAPVKWGQFLADLQTTVK